MIKITLSNGTELMIDRATKITAWKSLDSVPGKKPYYGKSVFSGSIDDGTEIGTSDPLSGISGLLSFVDWFSVDNGHTLIKTSAVVSLEITD